LIKNSSTQLAFIFFRGVFAKHDVSSNEVPMVMCLYPGIYSPGIPIHAVGCAEYLANQYGSDIEENAYIMNLTCGGYIDGRALDSQYDKEALDSNPSACGHMINHAIESNIDVLSFPWDVLTESGAFMAIRDDSHFSLPNEVRADASPWYYDTLLDELVRFPNQEQTPLPETMACGAAMILTTPISQGEELLLDYGLKAPYPTWAKGWYQGPSTK
jgi:hypothetical protein